MNLLKIGGLPPKLLADELEILKLKMQEIEDCEESTKLLQTTNVTHHLEEGVYGRELLLPEGTVVISRIHKAGSINVISQGEVIIVDKDGWREVKAPATFTSPKGTHRVVIALEDTVWTGVHHTASKDTDKLFDDLTCETYEEFTKYLENTTCGQQPQ